MLSPWPRPSTDGVQPIATANRAAKRPGAHATAAMALYEQVKEHIAQRIRSGEWPAGHRLPSEHELVAQFGISRMTANRALRELMNQGSIVRVAGVGSFVAEDKPQSTLLQIANIASEIRGRGHDYRFRLLKAERVAASPDVAAWMDVRLGDSLFHCVCLHLEDGVPMQLEDRFVNPRLVPAFLEQDFSTCSPSEYLLREVPLEQIEHVVDALLPSAEQAAQLVIGRDDPCLVLTRRTWTHGHNEPVTYVRCIHPGRRYRLGSRFRADPGMRLS